MSRVSFGAGILRAEPPPIDFLVADAAVAELFELPFDAPQLLHPAGERAKSVGQWQSVLDAFVQAGLDREAVVAACGGGTILDLAGFAAATYLRGVAWIAVPTTLLAQVDAAHGGKTGVNHPAAKNLVGAFHAPAAVVVDVSFLETLPEREVKGGLAEVVKHAVLGAPGLLDRAGRDEPAAFVEEAARVKLAIVEKDPLEKGERLLLNLGHTLGHAVERASGYLLHHGEAVAIGLRTAVRIAEHHCGFADAARVEQALDRCGLPERAGVDKDAVRAAILHDKKRSRGKLRWVLPVALGDVRVFDDVSESLAWDISTPLFSS